MLFLCRITAYLCFISGSGTSDDDGVIAGEDEEEDSGSRRNDVIEACQMLHDHFSGEKPLKQTSMVSWCQ